MGIKVYNLSEKEIRELGNAFGHYNYAEGEAGLAVLGKTSYCVSDFICGCVKSALKSGTLYSTSYLHEGFISFRPSAEKMSVGAAAEIVRTIPGVIDIQASIPVFKAMKDADAGYGKMLKKLEIPYIYVDLLVVKEEYQGKGFMRPLLEVAYEEAKKLNCPVVLETDAKLKSDKYEHLGMKCIVTQKLTDETSVYSLVYEPDTLPDEMKSDKVIEAYNAVIAEEEAKKEAEQAEKEAKKAEKIKEKKAKAEEAARAKEEPEYIWDKFSGIYTPAMKTQDGAYQLMYYRIKKVIKGLKVLEIGTGTGMIAKNVAEAAESVIATDFSEKMLIEASKGKNPENLSFQFADATSLPFPDGYFDAVIIANTLHLIPEPEKALSEISRVLRNDGGILIAPCFIHDSENSKTTLGSQLLEKAGITVCTKWNEETYKEFLESCGFEIKNQKTIATMIPLMYTELVKK